VKKVLTTLWRKFWQDSEKSSDNTVKKVPTTRGFHGEMENDAFMHVEIPMRHLWSLEIGTHTNFCLVDWHANFFSIWIASMSFLLAVLFGTCVTTHAMSCALLQRHVPVPGDPVPVRRPPSSNVWLSSSQVFNWQSNQSVHPLPPMIQKPNPKNKSEPSVSGACHRNLQVPMISNTLLHTIINVTFALD